MPRGVKRTEVEIIQAEIVAAEKKCEQSLKVAADAKKAITQLQNKIDQQLAKEIAKACRTAGIPLKDVLAWVQSQQAKNLGAEKPAAPEAPSEKKPAPAKKAATTRKPAAAKKPTKAPTRRGRKPKAVAQSVPAASEGTQEESTPAISE